MGAKAPRQLDLIVRNGRIINSDGPLDADVGIANGTIAQIGGEMTGDRELESQGLLVIPGGIDAHVHLSLPPGEEFEPRWVDDFTSGSTAALSGGITTLGNMTFPMGGETPLESLRREAALVREEAIADVFLHPVLSHMNSEVLDQIPHLPEAGCNSIKIFMSDPDFDAGIVDYVRAIRVAGEHGLITMMHCEDRAIIEDATAELVAAGRTSLRHYAESRPTIAEVVATQRAVAISEATGAPIYIVHLSSARALAACVDAQRHGVPVAVETRPLYLHLTRERHEEEQGAKYIGQPPLREVSDREALWAGIRDGNVNTVCSDHAPWTLETKLDPALSITDLRPGVENLQTLLPMIYSEGVRTGRISLERWVAVTSTNAAKLFGLYPRKGVIRVGSDADIVLFDPKLARTVERQMIRSRAGYSVFEGWEVHGWPLTTIRRGEIVFCEDEVIGQPGSGMYLQRGPTSVL
jgi:dihydropyrimidinase